MNKAHHIWDQYVSSEISSMEWSLTHGSMNKELGRGPQTFS